MTTKVQGTNGIEFPDGSVQSSAAYDKTAADSRYVNVAGDTMTGVLTINPAYAAGAQYMLSVRQGTVGNTSGIYFADGSGAMVLRGANGVNDIGAHIYPQQSNDFYAISLKSTGAGGTFDLLGSIPGTTNDFCIKSTNGLYSYKLQPGGAGWATLSTRASKQNIRPVESSLDKILALEPVRFSYKVSPDVESIGFVAEDICQVDPILASYDLDGAPSAVGKDNIVPFLVKAIQELSTKLDTALARIAELEAK